MDSGKLQAERDNIIGYNIDSLIIKGIDTITNQIIYAKIIFSMALKPAVWNNLPCYDNANKECL